MFIDIYFGCITNFGGNVKKTINTYHDDILRFEHLYCYHIKFNTNHLLLERHKDDWKTYTDLHNDEMKAATNFIIEQFMHGGDIIYFNDNVREEAIHKFVWDNFLKQLIDKWA